MYQFCPISVMSDRNLSSEHSSIFLMFAKGIFPFLPFFYNVWHKALENDQNMGRSEFLEGKLYQAYYFQTKMLKNQIFLGRLLLYKERKLMENNFAHCFLFKYHDFALFLNISNKDCARSCRDPLWKSRRRNDPGRIPWIQETGASGAGNRLGTPVTQSGPPCI